MSRVFSEVFSDLPTLTFFYRRGHSATKPLKYNIKYKDHKGHKATPHPFFYCIAQVHPNHRKKRGGSGKMKSLPASQGRMDVLGCSLSVLCFNYKSQRGRVFTIRFLLLLVSSIVFIYFKGKEISQVFFGGFCGWRFYP